MKFFSEIRICFLLISLLVLNGCGDSGGMDDGEENTGTPVVTAPSGPPAFAYDYSAENIDTAFHAYSNTKFRVIHTGECEYNFDLFIYYPDSDTTERYVNITQGSGNTDELFYYNLPENYYLIIPDIAPSASGNECNWSIRVESLFSGSGTTETASVSGNSDDSCPYSIQGCCSSHGGAVWCEGGRVKCGDGTFSPTCTCVCP